MNTIAPDLGRASRPVLINGQLYRVRFVEQDEDEPPPDGGFTVVEDAGQGERGVGAFRFEPLAEPISDAAQ